MIKVTFLYPNQPGSRFNADYYIDVHMPLALSLIHIFRVCLHTDARNERSRAAMERIGCKFEGILRSHRMSSDFIPRNSARYSIIAAEWPAVKQRLVEMAAPR